MHKIKVVVCSADKNVSAHIEGLDGFIITASSFEKLRKDLREALEFHIEGLYSEEVQPWMKGKFDFDFEFNDLEALLNAYNNILSQSAIARVVGVNEGLMRQYASGVKKPGKKIMERIVEGLRNFGQELNSIKFANA
jgi:predicted RNase H-like HicB family nuclease